MFAITRKQVREIDRISIAKYHIPGIVLMENAARGATEAANEMLGPGANQKILILCGGGNNGGDGLAIARHLHNRGHQILIGLCTDPAKYQGDAQINWRIVEAMNLPRLAWETALDQLAPPNLIIDAIFGTGLTEAPRPPFQDIVNRVTVTRRPIIAIDIPSGLDCDTGRPFGPCIRASRTVTFVAPKVGFEKPGAKEFTGTITVADIGCPREVFDEAVKLHP
ncbi:MAG TPA: NAD(P)H-hydrate epimerase [Tepidisphaeraceae bacterium]|jgi:NAD(P)H-hydrate epimerase|nr:NAD(P)H-hydrate epimerase [Tepidisphaeraceae bacterium]